MVVSLWIGISLIVIGLALILAEVMQPGLFLAVIGTVLVVLGILIALSQDWILTGPGALTLVVVAIVASWVTIMGYRRWAEPAAKPVTQASDSLPGLAGKVTSAIPAGGKGKVKVNGQSYPAVAAEPIEAGTQIQVESVEGFIVTVKRI